MFQSFIYMMGELSYVTDISVWEGDISVGEISFMYSKSLTEIRFTAASCKHSKTILEQLVNRYMKWPLELNLVSACIYYSRLSNFYQSLSYLKFELLINQPKNGCFKHEKS